MQQNQVPVGESELQRLQRRETLLETSNAALRVMVAALVAKAAGQANDLGAPSGLDGDRTPYEVLAVTVEKARTAMVVTDPTLPDNPIVFANQAFQRMSGYSSDELLGRNCRFMQGPSTDPQAIARVGEAIRQRHDITIDLVNYRKDGSSFLNELYISPAYGPDGELRYFFGCQTDATSYRDTVDRLEGNDDRWRNRFDRLQEGFMVGEFVRDAHGAPVDWQFVEVNDAWERLTGLSRRDAIGRTGAEVLPGLEPDWMVDFRHVAETGEARTVTRWVSLLNHAYEARIFRPEAGQFAVLFQDVTERLREEQRRAVLLELGELLREDMHPDELSYRVAAVLGQRLGVDRAGYGTIDTVAETITIARDWNGPGVQTLAGLLHFREHGSYIDDLKRGIMVAIPDTRGDPRTAASSDTLEAISARSLINMPLVEDGRFVALLYLNCGQARSWTPEELALVREVAERTRVAVARRRAEQDLHALTASLEQQVEARTKSLLLAEDQLRQSQKMEAVGQLTGGLAHDFNNLLTGIAGSLELLGTRVAQGRLADTRHYIAAAQEATQRAAALTHRLLAFSRRQTLDPSVIDVNQLIAGMEELIRRTVPPAIAIEVVGASGLWPALVDPNQLENVLLNLCINARDAMPDGGRITIETANRWLDVPAARERELPSGPYVSLCVTDTGTGMTPEVVARAFEPFFTTKPLGQGTGLGLSMIYGFARQSGGQVRIYSEPGQGTSLCLYLPRYQGVESGAPVVRAPPAVQPAEPGKTVLVVDDEPTVRMLVTEVLQDLGCTALEAADGASGLRVLQSDRRIDLLVTDVGLPGGINGRQVADAARVTRPDLKVLFITGYAEKAVVGNGNLGRDMHLLSKPFAMDMLAARITELTSHASAPDGRSS